MLISKISVYYFETYFSQRSLQKQTHLCYPEEPQKKRQTRHYADKYACMYIWNIMMIDMQWPT